MATESIKRFDQAQTRSATLQIACIFAVHHETLLQTWRVSILIHFIESSRHVMYIQPHGICTLTCIEQPTRTLSRVPSFQVPYQQAPKSSYYPIR